MKWRYLGGAAESVHYEVISKDLRWKEEREEEGETKRNITNKGKQNEMKKGTMAKSRKRIIRNKKTKRETMGKEVYVKKRLEG